MDFPVHVDQRGRSATTGINDHVRDLIEQVLFTAPGERVNLPDFGCGLLQLVFRPNSDVLSAATQFLVQGSLQRWLSDVIQVEQVQIENVDQKLTVLVTFRRRDTGQRLSEQFIAPALG